MRSKIIIAHIHHYIKSVLIKWMMMIRVLQVTIYHHTHWSLEGFFEGGHLVEDTAKSPNV